MIQRMNRRIRKPYATGSGDTSSSISSDEDINIPILQGELDDLPDI
jgi:hypothetical protein